MSRICPVCAEESPDEARYCFNPSCLHPLDPVDESSAAPTPPPAEERRKVAGWVWAAGAAGVAALVAGGIVVATSLGGGDGSATSATTVAAATTTAAATATTTVAPVTAAPAPTTPPRGTALAASSVVAAEATSTLPDQDGLTYGIANTLDGQLTTAWNSDGSTPGAGVAPVGQKLTYRLAAPQHLVGVRIVNGFNPNDGKHAFTDNHRVQTLVLRGGGQERRVDLADSFAPQFVEIDLPNTDAVELEVVSVYPTTKWPDVGITEVQFFVG